MPKALSTVTTSSILPAADPATDTLIRTFGNRLEETGDFRRRALPDRLAPTEVERAAMEARGAEIDRWLAPARPAAIKRMVGLVRGLMASVAVDDVESVLDGYALVLRPYPETVIDDVCGRFLDGRLGNRVYAPTPAEIAHQCRLDIADAKAERARIDLILDAEIYRTPSPEDQERIQERYRQYVAETTKRAAAPTGPAPESLPERRDPKLAVDLERRRARREAAEHQSAPVPAEVEETGET